MSPEENSKLAISNIIYCINHIGWDISETDQEGLFLVDLSAEETALINLHLDVKLGYQRFIMYANFEAKATGKTSVEVVRAISMLNHDMVIGNFEFQENTGFVRYKSSIDFTGVELSKKLIFNILQCMIDVIEDYADVLHDIIVGKSKVEEVANELD